MKVKIGNKIYDSEKQPVMVILNDQDKKNIARMDPECTKYIGFPKNYNQAKIDKWVKNE